MEEGGDLYCETKPISFRWMGDTLPSLQEALSLVIARSLKATEAISGEGERR